MSNLLLHYLALPYQLKNALSAQRIIYYTVQLNNILHDLCVCIYVCLNVTLYIQTHVFIGLPVKNPIICRQTEIPGIALLKIRT
jgi:hypothetical protein